MTKEYTLMQVEGFEQLAAAKYDLKEYTKEEAEQLSSTEQIDIEIEPIKGDYVVFLGMIRAMAFGKEVAEYLYAGYCNGKHLTTVSVVEDAFAQKWNHVLHGFDIYMAKSYAS